MSITLIAKQNVAAIADFGVGESALRPPVTLISNGLGVGESIPIGVSDDNGATYAPLMDNTTGLAVVLDSTHNAVSISSPGRYRATKPITVALVGFAVSTMANA